MSGIKIMIPSKEIFIGFGAFTFLDNCNLYSQIPCKCMVLFAKM